MVGIVRALHIFQVAGIAGRRERRVVIVHVTGGAQHRDVRAGQREWRRAVIEPSTMYTFHIYTQN